MIDVNISTVPNIEIVVEPVSTISVDVTFENQNTFEVLLETVPFINIDVVSPVIEASIINAPIYNMKDASLPMGGQAGQLLVKTSSQNYEAEWANIIDGGTFN
jgi:hypothetical protein